MGGKAVRMEVKMDDGSWSEVCRDDTVASARLSRHSQLRMTVAVME
jgi:hypothetical protein